MLKKALKLFFQDNFTVVVLIIIGAVTWSLTMVKSGLSYPFGIGFWGPNGHDGIWHLSLIRELAKGSLQIPVFAGETLQNYHIGFDVLLALLHKLTFLPISMLYFQIVPFILALGIGYGVYSLVLHWRKSRSAALWATFFVYFGGNFGWIISLIREGNLGGESMFWAQQAMATLINPPFALSILLILSGLIILSKYFQRQSNTYFFLSILVFGLLFEVKVYAGILSLGGLFAAGLYEYIKDRKSAIFKIFAGSLGLSIILFLVFNKNSSSLLVFQPLWFLETMMGFLDRLYWPKFFNAMLAYKQSGNLIKGIPAYMVAFGIFLVGNLGTRVIKEILVWKWIKNFKKLTYVEVFLAAVIGVGILFPMFFLQKGTPWNTIQFAYYSLTFSGILAGVTLGDWLEEKKTLTGTLVAGAVVLLTIPTTLGTLRHYLPSRPPAKLSYQEAGALDFLSRQSEGIVLTYPFDRAASERAIENPPRPLYLYESTAYVSAFSGQPVYLEDEVNLDITGFNWTERRLRATEFFESKDSSLARDFLKKNNISYIYLIKGQSVVNESVLDVRKIFENVEVDIFKVE